MKMVSEIFNIEKSIIGMIGKYATDINGKLLCNKKIITDLDGPCHNLVEWDVDGINIDNCADINGQQARYLVSLGFCCLECTRERRGGKPDVKIV